MANCYTALPRRKGELSLAKQLIAFDDPSLHLWFSLDFIPNVRDIDVLVWHEHAGVFVLEVKAVTLNQVERFGWQRCEIKGRPEDRGPQYQALEAAYSLKNFLPPELDLRIGSTACWPRISREEWNRAWDDERVQGEYSQRMIFEEDLNSGAEALADRLRHIWRNPPVRMGSRGKFGHDPAKLEDLRKALAVYARKKPAPSDRERLRVLEEEVSREALRDFPPAGTSRLLYYGHPGTGKTFRLLQLGLVHAVAGRRVLFSCFNKVLASDLKRLLASSQLLKGADGSLKVGDVFEMLSSYATGRGIAVEGRYDEWGELVVADMCENTEALAKYDTILVDEAQDMKDWALRMIELHGAPGASLCVAAGTGQELYGDPARWLDEFSRVARMRRLNRNFRNSRPVGRLAQLFYEAAPDAAKIGSALRRISKKPAGPDDEDAVVFARMEGRPPLLVNLDESGSGLALAGGGGFRIERYLQILESEYRRIIEQQVEQLLASAEARPIDLLVLVPGAQGVERSCALGALKSIRAGRPAIGFIDYTDESRRRQIAQPEDIRLSTFHSARGLEAERVVIFGLEQLANYVEPEGLRRIGYVTLSRSVFECVIAVRRSVHSDIIDFIERALAALSAK